jgi:conjugative transfer signal peptidase TraF
MSRGCVIPVVVVTCVSLSAIAADGWIGGYRLNLTPSEPLGLWRIEPLARAAAVGDVVFDCPPASEEFAVALERGYLRRGLCPSGVAPLIKAVVAVSGQRVDVGSNVVIDRLPLPYSIIQPRDGAGRPLHSFSGGIVPSGHLFLHSDFVSSYDSRYFGPVPETGLLGLARPVLTFDP